MLIASHRLDAPPPSHVQVIGERSSGTNYVELLIKRNLSLTPIQHLGWKHGFPSKQAIPSNLLVIASFRRLEDWLRSMHRKPWHTTPEMQRLNFSDFIRSNWETRIDRHDYFGLPKDDPTIGQALQLDRDPDTGDSFENILQLRTAKAHGHLSYENRECHFAALRMEDMQTQPEAVLSQIAETFELGTPGARYHVRRRLGSRFNAAVADRPIPPEQISNQDQEFIQAHLDEALEKRLGYM